MKRWTYSVLILCLLSMWGVMSAHSAEPGSGNASPSSKDSRHFQGLSNSLNVDAAWIQRWGGALDEFEHTTGIALVVQNHPKSPPADEDKVPGAYMHALSARLGLDQRGVLAVYFADEDDWRIWIGDTLTPAFVGHPGTVKELTDSKAIHDTKEAFFNETWAKSDAAFAALQKTAPAEHPATPADRIRIRTEMLLNGLMDRLRPKT